jgi:signal transduction histidine kinase
LLAGVVSRLVSNAIRHGQERGRVDIVGTLDGGGIEGSRTLTLAVVDDGPGIRADELPRLTRDTEPPRTSTAGSKRNGLGLVVTKRLVDLLGGRLRISSEPGRGTRAVVELPWVVLRTQPSGESAGHVSAPRDHAPDALASVTRE